MIARGFYEGHQVPAVRNALFSIKAKYGKLIAQAALITGLAEELIQSVVFIESAGKPDARSGAGALGLMQLLPVTAEDSLFLARKKDLLTADLITALNAVLAGKLSLVLKRPNLGVKPAFRIPLAWLVRPEVSILIGSVFLSLLIKEATQADGTVRLDLAIARYNRGYFFKPRGTIEELVASVPAETRGYILKLAGVNSTLDLLAA